MTLMKIFNMELAQMSGKSLFFLITHQECFIEGQDQEQEPLPQQIVPTHHIITYAFVHVLQMKKTIIKLPKLLTIDTLFRQLVPPQCTHFSPIHCLSLVSLPYTEQFLYQIHGSGPVIISSWTSRSHRKVQLNAFMIQYNGMFQSLFVFLQNGFWYS